MDIDHGEQHLIDRVAAIDIGKAEMVCSKRYPGSWCRVDRYVMVFTRPLIEAIAFFEGRVYTNHLLLPRLRILRMWKPRKSNPSSMWTTRVFSGDNRSPIGASTAATSARNCSACSRWPVTRTTKSSAYAECRNVIPWTSSDQPEMPTPARCCVVCGCTDDRACAGGYWWVARDLCSSCLAVVDTGDEPDGSTPEQHDERAEQRAVTSASTSSPGHKPP